MNKNKNVSIWRGDTPPPSKFHLWLKNNKLYHNDGIDWIENEIDNASNESDGLMSKEDKERLDNLVYDGLDSNDQNRALSANLGNVLLGKIETIKLSAYKVKGSVENISDIPLVDILLGDVYNILNSFYIDNKKYPEGTNVVWIGTQFDPLGGTVDFKDYSTTEQINEIVTTLENNVNNSLDNLNSIKSDKTYVNEQLATKADITYVDNKVSPKADTTYVNEQLATKANTGYVNAQVEILTTALETKVDKVSGKGLSTNDYTTEDKNLVATISDKADKTYVNAQLETKANKTYVDTQLASRSGLLHIGEVSGENDFFSRIATHAVVTNPAAQIVTATYKSGSGTGTLVALQQVRANISGDGGGTTMQYIYCNKRRYTRYIDFSATAIISVQSLQTEGVRNLQYNNGVLILKDIWGDTIGSTVNLTSVDKTAIREGTSTTDQVQLTVTKPFGNTASAYISAATSAKAGIMTAEMYNKLNNLVCDNLESDRGDLALSAKLGKILSNVINTNKSAINTKLQEEITRATNAENNLREDLNQRVHRDNIDTIISEYIESTPINTDKVYWESENKTQTEFNRDLLSKYFKLDSNLQESVNMLNAKIDGGSYSKDYEATLKYKIGRFDEWSVGGGHSFYADANLSYNTIRIELTKGLSIIIQPAFSCILVSVDGNWGTCLATFSKNDTTPYNILTTGTYYISLFDSSGYPVSNINYVATVITSYSSTTTLLENKIYLLEERIAALEGK